MLQRTIALLAALLMLSCAALAEGGLGAVADESQMTEHVDVVDPSWTPVTADMLNDGVYSVQVDSSSSMFAILGCDLTVADGVFSATLHMKSNAYMYLFPGTPEDAAAADPADLILVKLTPEGGFDFTFPIKAMDAGVECAAFSARKQLWYPRTLVFRSDSLPMEAWKAENLVTVATLGLADGTYSVDVALEGKGKTTLETPATLTVTDGAAMADIIFSTKKIDYVIVDGEKYLPTNTEGNAAFTVPVVLFDNKIAITVDSTAIKPATEVSYSMTFDSASIR